MRNAANGGKNAESGGKITRELKTARLEESFAVGVFRVCYGGNGCTK